MEIFFDCETAPTELDWFIDEIEIAPPGNYKKPESIQKWMEESADAERQNIVDKTAVDTSLAQIICLGYALGDGDVQTLIGPEREILTAFFSDLAGFRYVRLIGHNIIAFDIPLVYHRAIINGIRPDQAFHMNHKPWGNTCFDTMTEWAGVRDRISQDRLAKLLGIPTQETTGADILELYRNGDMEAIQQKCAFDVEQNRAIFQRISGL